MHRLLLLDVPLSTLQAEILAAVLPEELVEGSPVGFAATGHVGTPCPIYSGEISFILSRSSLQFK